MVTTSKTAAPSALTAEPTAATAAVATMAAQTDQAISVAKTSFGQASAKSREAMEEGLKVMDSMTTISHGNVDAFLESSRAASGAFQSIAEEAAQYSKKSAERTAIAVRSMAEAKTVSELMQVQSDFARAEFTTAIAGTTRLVQTVFATMTAIVAPLQSRAMAAVQTKDSPEDS
ncbi:phasin family protein [Sphingomonas sp.]|uniref:phasin family protein n=1 Tax=Sphingomonas sp. TaxID=28214 RepID=UPI0035A8C1F7